MPVLSAVFKAVDQMSATLSKMGDIGEEALDRWEQSATAADDALGRAADGATQATQAAKSATTATDHWTDAIGNYDKGAMEAVYSTEELVEMGYKTEASLGDAADAADKATDDIKGLGEETEKAGKKGEEFGEKSKGGIQSLEGALTSAGIVVGLKQIADGFLDCSEAAADYEMQLAKVSTIADTNVTSMSGISAEVVALSMETGKAAGGLADATYQALSAGVDTANSVGFAGDATKLAVGGFTDATTAVDVLTTALNAYTLQTSDATKIADMLVTTQNLGKTTVNELATNVGKVIPLAAAYGVEMDNLSTGYAIMTANGIATAESTTYIKAMLNELGTSSSTVAATLKDETGQSFAELTANGYSLGDVLGVLGDSVHGNTTAFNELWGSTEAGVGALSLFGSGAEKYNTVLGQMRDSAGATAAAYSIMADTTEYAQDRMSNSANNLAIAYGTGVNPAVETTYNLVADLLDGLTQFVSAHPALVAAVTAAVAVVGVAVVGLVAFSAVTTAATAITATFGTTVAAVFWPITAVVAGIAALVAGIAVIVNLVASANEEFDSLTATSKAQSEQLDELNAEY
ncbi:MAG: phage tail tape measure protein, partial [Oscillospiraceae bacterium]